VGNLGRDPELRHIQSGTAVCNFSVATNEKWKDKDGNQQESAEWHRVVVWDKQAKSCAEYLKKGRSVYVEGKLKTREYEKDGVKHWQTEVHAQVVQFLGGRDEAREPERDAQGGPVEPQQTQYENDPPF
jgi:single-strand DNA-binding protein